MTLRCPPRVARTLAVVPALGIGVLVQRLGGAPAAWTATQLAAASLGLLAALGSPWLARRLGARPLAWCIAFIASVGSTLLHPGLDGVRRWVSAGPLELHVAFLVEPLAVYCAALLWVRARTSAALAALAALFALHVAQPDAGQAASLAAGTLALTAFGGRAFARASGVAIAAVGLGATCVRSDPLLAVSFVEDALARAFALGPAIGVAGLAALLLIPGAAFARGRTASTPCARAFGAALGAYFAAGMAVTAFGAFPVPVLGYGASPVIGAMLGLSLLDDEVSGARA